MPSSRIWPSVGIVEPGDQLDDGGLALAVFADQRDPLAGRESEVEVAQDPARGAGIGEGDIAKLKAAADRTAVSGAPSGLDSTRGFHLEEGQQIGEEERLVGNARRGREHLLQIAGLACMMAVGQGRTRRCCSSPAIVRQMT